MATQHVTVPTVELIRNNTGQTLQLMDGRHTVATIHDHDAAHQVQLAITNVALGATSYNRGGGGFVAGKSYVATLVPASHDHPRGVVTFAADGANPVTFV